MKTQFCNSIGAAHLNDGSAFSLVFMEIQPRANVADGSATFDDISPELFELGRYILPRDTALSLIMNMLLEPGLRKAVASQLVIP